MKTTRKNTNRKSHNAKLMGMVLLGSTALMGGLTTTASAESEVRISYNSSGYSSYGHSNTAGILVVDGRQFTIYSSRNIGSQIVRILRRCGYDASSVRGQVVVCYDHHRKPNVCWYQRGYSASIHSSRGRMNISWCKVNRRGHSYKPSSWGSSWSWSSDQCNSGRDRGWNRGHDSRRGKGRAGGRSNGHSKDHKKGRGKGQGKGRRGGR